jgi:protein-tyrosine phosphatase
VNRPSRDEADVAVSLPLDDPRRLVRLDAVHNFRDLGGYPARDGAVTRWRTLFRSDGLYRLTVDDRETVRGLGLATVIDLRSQAELDERGRFPHEQLPVDFLHLPVIDTTWEHYADAADMEAVAFLTMAYTEMLEVGWQRFAAAIHALARPSALPAVFHCAAGKDRTGLLAALVLSAIGVPRLVVLHDYALTTAGIQRMREWVLRESPEMAARMLDAPDAFMAAAPEALDIILSRLCAEHGSIEAYLVAIGVSTDVQERLADLLLDPVPRPA